MTSSTGNHEHAEPDCGSRAIARSRGPQVSFLCSETHELGEELVASYLHQVHLHHWLECNDYGRILIDDDL
jgi:hypothetical protein